MAEIEKKLESMKKKLYESERLNEELVVRPTGKVEVRDPRKHERYETSFKSMLTLHHLCISTLVSCVQ